MRTKRATLLLLTTLAVSTMLTPAHAASPEDLVPAGSGLYDAVALLTAKHLTPPGSPDATRLQGVTARLYTRRELADIIRPITDVPADARAAAALAYCRNILAPEIGMPDEPYPNEGTSTPAVTGFAEATAGGRDDQGTHLRSHGELLGRGRLLGTLGRDGAYTVSVTNIYRQTRLNSSISTRDDGHSGGDEPDLLNGIDEAYVTAVSNRGLRVTVGELRQRWGSGYRGRPAHGRQRARPPHLPAGTAFFARAYLGRLPASRSFCHATAMPARPSTTARGGWNTPSATGPRCRWRKTYTSTEFGKVPLQVLPYYLYQKAYLGNSREPYVFNYNLNIGFTVTPRGPGTYTAALHAVLR